MKLIKELARYFRKPTVLERVARELAEAQFALMDAQTSCEYAHAQIVFNEARIKRLRAALVVG